MLQALMKMVSKKYMAKKFDSDSWSTQLAESQTLSHLGILLYVLSRNIMFDMLGEHATCSMCYETCKRTTKRSQAAARRAYVQSDDDESENSQQERHEVAKPIESCTMCEMTFHLECVMNQPGEGELDRRVQLYNKSVVKSHVSIACQACYEKKLQEKAEKEAAEAREKELVISAIDSNRYAFRVNSLRVKR